MITSTETAAPNRNRTSSAFLKHWLWAYRKIRSLQCGQATAIWRATRLALSGSSGRFFSSRGWTKLRLTDD